MPRMIRLESPGTLVHIMARGIEGMDIFNSRDDYNEFILRFKALLKEIGYKCLAWCLMSNHYHLMLRTNEQPMAKLMRPLNGGYARWFNKKYQRRGYLFQDRFKSVLCQDSDYAKQLIRYIHLNPVRAGKVKSLSQLRKWTLCGHAFLLGNRKVAGSGFQDAKDALRYFGTNENNAIKAYLAYMAEGINAESPEISGCMHDIEKVELLGAEKGWPAVIGNPEFVKDAMSRHRIGLLRKHRKADYFPALKELEEKISRRFKIESEDLFIRGRQNVRSDARALFCFKANEEELIPFTVIAEYLRMAIPPASRLAKRGKIIAARDKAGG